MGYSVNPETVESRRHLLKGLEAGKSQRWTCTADPMITRRMANQIREALHIAARYPKRFPALALAAERFAIFIVADGLIEARLKGAGRTETSVGGTPIQGLEPIGNERTALVGLTTAVEIINAWKAHLPSSDTLHFTRTTLTDAELLDLYTWTRKWTPRLMFLVGDQTLTLSLDDITVREFAWRPYNPDPEPEEEFNL